jgi:processive 1,2-diacylglycerol beta-glucosyltransferase
MKTATGLRVMVLTLSFGSGHVRAARAVADAIRAEYPDADVCPVDALERCRWMFRAIYVWPYWVMIRHARWLWARLFSTRLTRLHRHTAPAWAFRLGCPAVFDDIARFRPDLIVAVEVGASEMAAIAKRRGLTGAVVVNVITDYQAEPAWVAAEIDRYLIADPVLTPQLTAWGAPAEHIVPCGIPIGAAFFPADDRDAAQADGLDDRRPLVLLMGGGMGPTRMDRVAAGLCASDVPMRIVALAGRDRAARRRLSRLRASTPVSLDVRGWTEDVAGLMRGAALLVTKPGGVTLAEAAACAVPLVLFDPIPGPEERNAAFVANAGSALVTSGLEAAGAVTALLRDPGRRRSMERAAGRLARPDAARASARAALEACRRRPAADAVPTLMRDGAAPAAVPGGLVP